jgi:hypothetical protein
MKNIKKIAVEILTPKQIAYKVPFDLETENVDPKQPRIVLDLTKVATILEEKYKTKKGKTEISQGKNNEIIFDLEWVKAV